MSSALVPLLAIVLVVAVDGWVLADAKAHEARGTPVVFSNDFVTLDTPIAWVLGCLILFIVVVPLYLTVRRQAR